MLFTKNQLIKTLEQNSIEQKNAKYSNSILLAMIKSLDFETIEAEPTRDRPEMPNRGSLCEALVKIAYFGYKDAYKTSRNADIQRATGETRQNSRDLNLDPNRRYEVKFNTSFALAHDSQVKTKQLLLVIREGVYLVDSADYVRATFPQGQRLDELSKRLGFQA